MDKRWAERWATFFHIGNFPVGPGTAASFVGALLAVALSGAPVLYVLTFFIVVWMGYRSSGVMEEITGEKDPGRVVIDEVAGIMIAFFLLPVSWPVFWTAFFLFRAFDMFKIYPGKVFELKGGAHGIMMDDIIAGIYTNVIMHIVLWMVG
ncbi:MAG: phosphatidylglycerophosphatase A [Candidatus Omnitrophota bacterium]